VSLELFPSWVVLHVPHDSTWIPDEVRQQFLVSDTELAGELLRMTDHFTHDLFASEPGGAAVVRAKVSRLVVDVERFADDFCEPMAERGMGAIYRVTSALTPLRGEVSEEQRAALMQSWYHPHHQQFENAVDFALDRHGHCLIIDCHSFPSQSLPYERTRAEAARPDICIGTDDFHTSTRLTEAFMNAFSSAGWSVALNDPFAGAIVPASRYGKDARVSSLMVEVNRRLYVNEGDGRPHGNFHQVAQIIRKCIAEAIRAGYER